MNNLGYLPTKQKMRYISGKIERAPLVSFVPSNYIIIDLNKSYNIRNGAELAKIEYILLLTHSMSDISRM